MIYVISGSSLTGEDHCRICVTHFRQGQPFCSPHPGAVPDWPILNSFNTPWSPLSRYTNVNLLNMTVNYIAGTKSFEKINEINENSISLLLTSCFFKPLQSCHEERFATVTFWWSRARSKTSPILLLLWKVYFNWLEHSSWRYLTRILGACTSGNWGYQIGEKDEC